MRLFRRARDTKTSVIRREAVSAVAEAASMPLAPPSRPSSPIAPVVDSEPALAAAVPAPAEPISAPRALVVPGIHPAPAPSVRDLEVMPARVPPDPPSYDGIEDSDVFVCRSGVQARTRRAEQAAREVTLFVHGWHNVEPGLLSWTFPSLRAALDAVQRMKNAIGWCVVSGTGWKDLEAARAKGAILVEQLS